MGGKGIVLVTGEVGDVTAATEAGGKYAKELGMLHATTVIAAPHAELWEQL
jgi:microcompartment protein CcmL/EutN